MTADAANERINRRVAVLERLLEEKGVLAPGELDAAVAAAEAASDGGHETWEQSSGAQPWGTRYE